MLPLLSTLVVFSGDCGFEREAVWNAMFML